MKNWQQGIYSIAPILKGHKGKITAFDSDGFTIASGCRESRDLKIWSVEECECINTIKLKTDSINCLKLYVTRNSKCLHKCSSRIHHL